MTQNIRFTLNPELPFPTPDGHRDVLAGTTIGEKAIDAATGKEYALSQVRLLPPVSPTKIVCIGRNYVDHAKELGNPVPAEPIVFMKPPSSLNGPGGPVVYPKLSQQVSFEGELGVIIGRRAWQVRASDADSYIGGYTIVNDMTARDLQKKDGQWTRGKGFDTFCPVGPCWVPAKELHRESLRVKTLVDGELRQNGPVADMIFPVPVIIEFVTQFMTLEPGDLIATGTPPGVGPVMPGNRIRVEIEGIGFLENPVVAP
jgi:2-keto-4-pentenoate hydratase/2-oxohepta-3-ene-1,7-dioic acid hydratase in catechol pathway